MIDDFATRFPTIWRACQSVGLDPTHDWLPVAPAAHYLSGGVVTDLDGATTLPRLWACGEAACSGVHGANRLASNSLLDGLVFGPRVVEAIAAGQDDAEPTGAMTGVLRSRRRGAPTHDPVVAARATRRRSRRSCAARSSARCRPTAVSCATRDGPATARATRSRDLGRLADELPTRIVATYEVAQPRARVARRSSLPRPRARSRAASHTRADFPDTSDAAVSAGSSCRARTRPASCPLAGVRAGRDRVSDVRPAARRVLQALVALALAEDLGLLGDITSIALHRRRPERRRRRSSRAKTGVLAGTAAATEVFRQVDAGVRARVGRRRRRRGRGRHGRSARLHGSLRSILTGERVALELPVPHCSGVATLTRRYVRAARGDVAHPRHAQDAAGPARAGEGGGAGRRRLQPPRLAVRRGADQGQPPRRRRASPRRSTRARARWPGRIVEVECDTLEQVAEARDAGADIVHARQHDARARCAKAVRSARRARARSRCRAASRSRRSRAYAEAGADFISIGAITHSAPALDIGLDID